MHFDHDSPAGIWDALAMRLFYRWPQEEDLDFLHNIKWDPTYQCMCVYVYMCTRTSCFLYNNVLNIPREISYCKNWYAGHWSLSDENDKRLKNPQSQLFTIVIKD